MAKHFADAAQADELEEAQQAAAGKASKATLLKVLLRSIKRINLVNKCRALGWNGDADETPKEKHFKVAIVDEVITKAAKLGHPLSHHDGFWYIFNGAYWLPLDEPEIKQLLKHGAIKVGYTAIECRDSTFVDKLYQQAQQESYFTDKHAVKPSCINLQNGTLVLDNKGMNLKPFDYRDFITHQLDFDYNPAADNALFAQYLNEVLPCQDTQRTLQEVAGYLFIRGLKLEKFFFLYGGGANGKSVFFECINGLLGKENISHCSLENLTDTSGYYRAMIKDKIVNYATDIRFTKIDAGKAKQLASGEPIEARLPYKNPFMMEDYAKLIFNINVFDSANVEHTLGFWRRFVVIPFDVTIPQEKQDRDLPGKLLADKAGILNWIIEGAASVIKNRDVFVSEACLAAKATVMKNLDSVALYEDFVKETTGGNIYYKSVTEAYQDYKLFCKDAGYNFPLSRNNFSNRMVANGFQKSHKTQGWMLEKHFKVFPK